MFTVKELLDEITEYLQTSVRMVDGCNNQDTRTIALIQGHALIANMLVAVKYEMEELTRLLLETQSNTASAENKPN